MGSKSQKIPLYPKLPIILSLHRIHWRRVARNFPYPRLKKEKKKMMKSQLEKKILKIEKIPWLKEPSSKIGSREKVRFLVGPSLWEVSLPFLRVRAFLFWPLAGASSSSSGSSQFSVVLTGSGATSTILIDSVDAKKKIVKVARSKYKKRTRKTNYLSEGNWEPLIEIEQGV